MLFLLDKILLFADLGFFKWESVLINLNRDVCPRKKVFKTLLLND